MIYSLLLALVLSGVATAAPWRFAVLGDTHVPDSDTIKEMIPFLLADGISFVLVGGDLAQAGKMCTSVQLQEQLTVWQNIFAPLYEKGIGVYSVRGNHEDDAKDDITAWNAVFTGPKQLPQNGPAGEKNLTYSFTCKNALVVGLDDYIAIHQVNQEWLNQQFTANTLPHVFVFGHEAAFKVFHADCLDDSTAARNVFWQSLSRAGARVYFCGHDHFFDVARIDDKNGNLDDDIYQVLVGSGGGWRMSRYNYNGENDPYTPVGVYHEMQHGYVVVEVSGDDLNDRHVTIAWKERTFDTVSSTVAYCATSKVVEYTATGNTAIPDKPITPVESKTNVRRINGGVAFTLPRPGLVSIQLYSVKGQCIMTSKECFYSAGPHLFFYPEALSEGLYICKVTIGAINKGVNGISVIKVKR